MNLRHLAVFHAVARAGSINAAAPELHTSQPAISRELRLLEGRLGSPLFDRLPRGMRLTEAGQTLFEYSERIFSIEQAAERALRDLGRLNGGELVIGASNTVGTFLLPTHLARFISRYPKIRVVLQIANTEEVVRGLQDSRFALGFVEAAVGDDAIDATVFEHDVVVPVVAPGHSLAARKRLTVQALAQAGAMLREPGSGTRELVEQEFSRHGVDLNCDVQISTSEALKRAAMAGCGVAWISRLWVVDELADGRLIQLPASSLHLERPLYALRLRGRHLSRGAAEFMREFDEQVPG